METIHMCAVCKETPTPSEKHEFCEKCAKARRTWQLKVNNEKWKMRLAQGETGHRIMYRGEPTEWARANPVKAIREAIKQGYDDDALEKLIKGL